MTVLEALHQEDVKERITALPTATRAGRRWTLVPETSKFFTRIMGTEWPMNLYSNYMIDWWFPVLAELDKQPPGGYEIELLCRYRHGALDNQTTNELLGVFRTETIVLFGRTNEMEIDFAEEGENFIMVNLTDYGADVNRVLMVTLLGMSIRPFEVE